MQNKLEEQESNLENFPNGSWFKIPQRMVTNYYGTEEEYNVIIRNEQIMTYDHNNGILAFVDGEGHMYVAPYTSDRMSALEEAGYKKGGIWVPFSNGELPADPELQSQWKRMKEEADEQNRSERIESQK